MHLYSQEQKHVIDLLYDFERSKNGIFLLKSHALRSINQESAKQEALQSFDSQSVLLVIGCDEISLNEIQRKAK